jgi:sugar phosphate isomerase/epimerase
MFGGSAQLLEVVEATRRAGFDAIGIDVRSIASHGSVDDVASAITDSGMRCSDVAGLIPGADKDHIGAARNVASLAELLGAPVCVASVHTAPPWSELVEQITEAAAVLWDHGCRLAIEFIPYGPVRDLLTAKRLCSEVGWQRCGVVIDSLHFFRSGAPYDELTSLQPRDVAAVQWSDAPRAPRTSLVDEARHGRLLPGDGDLALPRLAESLRTLGYDGIVTAEVLSAELRVANPATLTMAVHAALRCPESGWLHHGSEQRYSR